jgi:Tol biopolymer transport system component
MRTSLVSAAVMLAGAHSSAFSPPDCVRAVPAGTHNGQMVVAVDGKRGLWLAAASGKVKRQLTRGRDGLASFSPSGRKIVFQRQTRGGRDAIVTHDMFSGRTRTIFTSAGGENAAERPVWTPDGRWIAFLRDTSSGSGDDERYRTDVVMIRPDGTGAHAVHRVSSLTNIPTLAVSRNGRCFAYQWGSFDEGALAIRNPDFSEGVNLIPFRVVMPDGARIFVPESVAFSADGRRLYVTYPIDVSGKSAGDRLYAIALDKPTPPEAVADQAAYALPSPDGRSLAYRSLDDGWTHVLRLRGSPRDRRVLNGIVWDWAPAR